MSVLSDIYLDYIACLNQQAWSNLHKFVHSDVQHNKRPLGLDGYLDMLKSDFSAIPDLRYNIEMLIADTSSLASRLHFDCTPKGSFLSLPINGKRITFAENVFYRFQDNKIQEVWSVIDKVAIEAQLG